MLAASKTITPALHLTIVSKCWERIADHITNIAEMGIFMVKARVIKYNNTEFKPTIFLNFLQ